MAKKYNSQTTISSILDAARKLFLEKGFEQTSMRDIAAAAKLSKGAIYHHFESKEVIFQEVMTRQEKTSRNVLDNLLSESSSLTGKEQLQFILQKTLDSQKIHDLDRAVSSRMKSAEFILSYMQNCVNNDSRFIAAIVEKGNTDGSLQIAFPDEYAEVFLLLLNIWCDPAVFKCDLEKIQARLSFLQHLTAVMGGDVISDDFIVQTIELLKNLYFN